MIFEDKDLTFDANYLVSVGGEIIIGTAQSPFSHKALITMHGLPSDKQLPIYGNKVWALQDSVLEMNGQPKNFVKTLLSKTASAGDETINIEDSVDWVIGEEIVIVSTDYLHEHAETRTIVSIDIAQKAILLDKPLVFDHYSSIDKYGDQDFPMQAEVALLTRNVVFQGFINPEYPNYSSHIYITNDDSITRIAFCEFRNVGQTNILDRYPLNLHNIQDASKSYLIGNTIHNSFSRAINLNNVNNLNIKNNVAYLIYGSTYVLESGLETNNVLDNNLGISTLQAWTLMNIDITPATFYISNPSNIIINNRAAGGDWVGFNYDLESISLLDPYVCPSGNKFLEFSNNIAHSNAKFGLYIYQYIPRTKPCQTPHSKIENDWLSENSGIKAIFKNFAAFSNYENGVLAEYIGNIEFNGFLIADSNIAGIQISDTMNTYIDGMKLNGCLIVGISLNLFNETHINAVGLITPRTDNLFVFNVAFFNFTQNQQMKALLSCSKCWNYNLGITGGKTTKFELLSFTNVDQKVSWGGAKKEVYIDIDGSLLGERNSMITAYYPHLDGIKECNITDNIGFDYSIICNSSIQIRTLMFRSLVGVNSFLGIELKIYRIPALNFNVSNELNVNASNFTNDLMRSVTFDTPYTWDLPFVTGYIYNLHWNYGNLDFTHMNLLPSLYWAFEDKAVILKFNCSDYKDDYKIKIMQFNGTALNVSKIQNSDFNLKNFNLGDYSFSNTTNELIIGVNGQMNGSLELNTIRIAPIINDTYNETDANGTEITPDWNNIRYWSNASLWPNGYIPLDGEDVWIKSDWIMILDIETTNLGTLTVDGLMMFESSGPLRLKAERIWVRDGKLLAGNATNAYENPIEIILLGGKTANDLVIDSFIESGNKILAVTGEMNLYGKIPKTAYTRLTRSISIGTDVIDLLEAVDWSIGSEIVIGPTEKFYNPEKRIIKDLLNGGRTIVADLPFEGFHYGSSEITYKSDDGLILDMRATVGLLSRNIQIKGDKVEDWGCNILVYQYTDQYNGRIRRGNFNLQGVEISYCGQSDTERASLDIKYVKKGAASSLKSSTIHDAYGWGLYVLTSNSLQFENNLIFDCQKFLAKFSAANTFAFSNNLLIAARNRNLKTDSNIYDMVAGFSMEKAIVSNPSFIIDYNIIQGSQGNGFVLPGFNCDDNLNSFIFNQVNSIQYAGLLLLGNSSQCIEIRNLSISSSKYAILSNFETLGIHLNSMIFAENLQGPLLMYSHDGIDNRILYENLVFMALARSDCFECYLNESICSESSAVILPIITISGGRSLPINSATPLGIMTLLNDAAFDQRLYLKSVKFFNYKMNYKTDSNANFASCHSNRIFAMKDSAPDATSSVYIYNTTLFNSENSSFFLLSSPSANLLGVEGGCGNLLCTGELNWLFTDEDGLFLGNKGQIIPLNPGINSAKCQVTNNDWNGQFCSGYAFGVLQFQNTASDQRTRPIAPVNLTSQHMNNVLNQWKEWLWQGKTPMNRRLSRFHGIIELNVSVDVEFVVTVPQQMKFRLESKDSDDFVLLNIVYERSNVIEVWNTINSKFIEPSRANSTNLIEKNRSCGANVYDSNLNKISFILTAEKDCVLSVRTINAVRVNLRMETTLDDFYKNDGEATFFDKISTFLGIDFSRIRIANIRAGSVIVDFQIVENKGFDQGASSTDSINLNINDALKTETLALEKVMTDFIEIVKKFGNVTSDMNNTLGLPWKVLDLKTESVVSNPNNLTLNVNGSNVTTNESSDNNGTWVLAATNNTSNLILKHENDKIKELIVVLSIIIPGLLLFLIIGCCCIKMKNGLSLFKWLKGICFANKNKVIHFTYDDKLQNVKINQIVSLFLIFFFNFFFF